MFRVSRSFRRLPSPANNKARHWYKILVILVLALSLSGVGQTTSVQAAPHADATIYSFDLSTSPIPSPACAHSLFDVQFFANVESTVDWNDQQVKLQGGLGPSDTSVNATSSDTSVAEFHPDSRTASALDNSIGGRSANFQLKTEAPGSATLAFTAEIKWAGQSITLPPLQLPIKVVNCKFKVTITTILLGVGPDIMETVVSKLTGEISGDENAALAGEAEVIWNAQQVTPCLSVVQVVPPSKATLEGSLGENGSTLTVHVNYGLGMAFSQGTTTCKVSVTGTYQHQFQPPPLSFTVPTTGGSLSQPVTFQIGTGPINGTAIITVVPIEGK
jgi:hypothetical protein